MEFKSSPGPPTKAKIQDKGGYSLASNTLSSPASSSGANARCTAAAPTGNWDDVMNTCFHTPETSKRMPSLPRFVLAQD
ncbi:hypothetical protein NMY22_g17128 [Coprinellus aureogranulatus]|nr:hypothetical protein NMY22_g17128 [Coprinellus aureogranulatus]